MKPWYGTPNHVISFLNIWNMGFCVKVTNLFQIRQVLLCRLSQAIGYSSLIIPRQIVLPRNGMLLKRMVLSKRVSGRTVQTRRDNSIFVIRSKERNLGSNSGVSYCDWYESLYNKMYGLRSNLQLNHVGKARANLSGAQTRYCCWTTVYLWYTRKRWWALTPELAECQYNPR